MPEPSLLYSSEFWAVISGATIGAIVGGLISFLIQLKVLREGRAQREEEHSRVRSAQANSLLFKMIRIHSNFHLINRHFRESFERADTSGFKGEPWQFVIPIANPPSPVNFTADEMGMLLSLKDDDVFNNVLSMDSVHNGLVEVLNVHQERRSSLSEALPVEEADGKIVSSVLSEKQVLALRPKLIEINELVHAIRDEAQRSEQESEVAMFALQELFKAKMGISYTIKLKTDAAEKALEKQAPSA